MGKVGWLVNDRLTCIPGTKTFWHDLLEWFPLLVDKTGGYTKYPRLADRIEREASIHGDPPFIIRNATFFRRINLKSKTISFLQDIYTDGRRSEQIDVGNNSEIVVFNSNFVKHSYENELASPTMVVPIGTDFGFFKPSDMSEEDRHRLGVLPESILFIGSQNKVKGFDKILWLIENTKYNFCLIMKDNFHTHRDNVRVFNSVNQAMVRDIINSCFMLVCSSEIETLHLAGVEAAACNLPLLVTDVGIYYGMEEGRWGIKVKNNNYLEGIEYIFKNKDSFSPRQSFLDMKLDKESCRFSWKRIIESL